MSVPIRCPNCGVGHLHASVAALAETSADRFEVLKLDDEKLIVRDAGSGELRVDEGTLSCCACDWSGDFPVEIVIG